MLPTVEGGLFSTMEGQGYFGYLKDSGTLSHWGSPSLSAVHETKQLCSPQVVMKKVSRNNPLLPFLNSELWSLFTITSVTYFIDVVLTQLVSLLALFQLQWENIMKLYREYMVLDSHGRWNRTMLGQGK